ncbi:unnamed protein product, partial [Polarella glacialis]
CDLHTSLLALSKKVGFTLTMKEVDLLRAAGDDVQDENSYWESLMKSVDQREWDVVIATPPCHTHSRARNSWQTSPGPRPLRSLDHPWGFPWLSGKNLRQCEVANICIERTFDAIARAHQAGAFHLVEHPEDLGTTLSGESPASLWQAPQLMDLQALTGACTWALYQCSLGAPSPRPTRLFSDLPAAKLEPFQGWPVFNKNRKYLGPLPTACGHVHDYKLLGRLADGFFRTSPTAAYLAEMCEWLAQLIVRSFFEGALEGGGKTTNAARPRKSSLKPAADQASRASSVARHTPEVQFAEATVPAPGNLSEAVDSEAEDQEVDKMSFSNQGPPITTFWDGKAAPFNDGFGLCSPGRWLPAKRGKNMNSDQREFCKKLADLLDKMVMALALGKVKEQPFSGEKLESLRSQWCALLPDPAQAASVPEFQPFLLFALGQSLCKMGDPDWQVIADSPDSYASGVPVGVGIKMPRAKFVFRKKVKWRKYDDSEAIFDMKNYSSAHAVEDDLEKQFRSEELLGMMYPTSMAVARQDYPGSRLRVAAQGALRKPDGSYRALHDGTHGGRVNNEILMRDQLEFPGPREDAAAMEAARRVIPGVHFCLAADVRKAHRRVLRRKADWGLMACRSHEGSETIWVKRVGTFGIGSIAYWWGRLAAAAGRFVLRLCLNSFVFMSIFADDLKVVAGGADKWKVLLRVFMAWIMIGAPFAWEKFRGGLELDWIGYWLDYTRFELGVSERRTLWLCKWLEGAGGGQVVQMRRFAEGLGRLGFAARALVWLKPFLAPLYAWAAAVPEGTALKPPLLVQLTVAFLLDNLQNENRGRISCATPEVSKGELFRTDSKGADDCVVLGGWETNGAVDTMNARWFSLTLTREQVPFLFKEGKGSSWSSTSSELLASMVALQLFGPDPGRGARAAGEITCSAGTDNQANESL